MREWLRWGRKQCILKKWKKKCFSIESFVENVCSIDNFLQWSMIVDKCHRKSKNVHWWFQNWITSQLIVSHCKVNNTCITLFWKCHCQRWIPRSGEGYWISGISRSLKTCVRWRNIDQKFRFQREFQKNKELSFCSFSQICDSYMSHYCIYHDNSSWVLYLGKINLF